MTTAEALERINEGDFQVLATAVLSQENVLYSAVLETGGNARGHTIKAESDGCCQVPGSDPPHFVLVEHTTTERKSLKDKWLHAQKGDLIKQGRRAARLREQFPQARFTVVLCSSRHLPDRLPEEVWLKAQELGVEPDLWDGSRLTRALDKPQGQWLRHKYLGSDAQDLSLPLLRDLCERSLELHARSISLADGERLIERDEGSREPLEHEGEVALHILLGASGCGKSTSLHQRLRKYLDSGGYGLWLPAEYVAQSLDLHGALEKLLRDLHPALAPGAEARLWELLPASKPLWIVVDDLNRHTSPAQAARQIIGWVRPMGQSNAASSGFASSGQPRLGVSASGAASTGTGSNPWTVFCSLWPQAWATLGLEEEGAAWMKVTRLGQFSLEEGERAVRAACRQAGIEVAPQEARALSAKLGHDPFLLGLFAELASTSHEIQAGGSKMVGLEALSTNVVERYVNRCCQEAALNSPSHFITPIFRRALSRLGTLMIEHRDLAPSWTALGSWMPDGAAGYEQAALRELAHAGALCHISEAGDARQARWEFRHDRLRQMFLVEAMEERLQECASEPIGAEAQGDKWAPLAEPFFAEVIGQALSRVTLPGDGLRPVCKYLQRNPVALTESLRHLPPSDGFLKVADASRREAITDGLGAWARDASTCGAPWTLLQAVGEVLESLHDPTVLSITEPLPNDQFLMQARLHNGSISSSFLHYIARRWEACDTSNVLFRRSRAQHRSSLAVQLGEILQAPLRTKSDGLNFLGAARMVGLLRLPELLPALRAAWQQLPGESQQQYLALFLLSLLDCYVEELPHLPTEIVDERAQMLDELLDLWQSLSDEKADGDAFSDRWRVRYSLYVAFGRSWTEEAVGALVAQVEARPALAFDIVASLWRVDSPCGMEFVVRHVDRQSKAGEESTWTLQIFLDWNREHGLAGKKRLSRATIERLQVLWADESLSERARSVAFALWCTNPSEAPTSVLAEVSSAQPFFGDAMRERVRRGDTGAVPFLLQKVREDASSLQSAAPVWCSELLQFLLGWAGSVHQPLPSGERSADGRWLLQLLARVPAADAEKVLAEHWDHLSVEPHFLLLALWVGTPRCLEMAAERLQVLAPEVNIFEYLEFQLPLWPREGEEARLRPRVQRFVSNILPYIDRLDQDGVHLGEIHIEGEMSRIIEACLRVRAAEWGCRLLYPHLSSEMRRRFFPSDDELLAELDALLLRHQDNWENRFHLAMHFWAEEARRRDDAPQRAAEVVLCWLEQDATPQRFAFAAAVVYEAGWREHAARLDALFELAQIEGTAHAVIASHLDAARFAVQRRGLD